MASISAAPTTTSTTVGRGGVSASKSNAEAASASHAASYNSDRSDNMSGTTNHHHAAHASTTNAESAAAETGEGAVPTSPVYGESSQENISYSAERIIGNGSFGVVFEAKVVETNEVVAIKKVLQDKRFKNRELQIMRQLVKDPHTNIVALKHCFYSQVRFSMQFVVSACQYLKLKRSLQPSDPTIHRTSVNDSIP